jgi:hypothetical protein
MTEAEVQVELNLSIEAGDTERAGYVEEFLCELQAECNACDSYNEETGILDCTGCHIDSHQEGCDENAGLSCCRDWNECVGCPESGDCADEN